VPTPADIRATIDRYAELFGDERDGWVGLFAADATVEDPVGSDLQVGHEQIGLFWDLVHGMADSLRIERTGPVRVVGSEAAFPFQIHSVLGGAGMVLDVIDVMTFDDDACITTMRAFWDMADLRAVD